MKIKRNYDDIINLPHHISKTRPRMSLQQRSAQFAPFSALTGYEDEITETGRIVDTKRELDEEVKQMMDIKLQEINRKIHEKPLVTITYFIADRKKEGGKYETIAGHIKKIDKLKNMIIFSSGEEILINDILDIEINTNLQL